MFIILITSVLVYNTLSQSTCHSVFNEPNFNNINWVKKMAHEEPLAKLNWNSATSFQEAPYSAATLIAAHKYL